MQKKLLNDRVFYLLAGVACVLVYAPVVFLDFQRGWDDGWMVMNRFTFTGFTIDNLKTVFTEFYAGQYGPVNEVIYMAIYAVFGYNPAVYHLYPLLLHIANSCLVLLFIKRLTGRYADPTTVRYVSFFTALLFSN